MKVSVIGTGYVGLVSGTCLAEKGHDIVCVDIDQEKIDMINQGIPPIHEDGLDELLKKNVNKTLRASSDLVNSVLETDLSLIAVGTPFDGKEIDLTHIKEVSRQIGTVLRDKTEYHVVVVKSTVVPGTTDGVVLPILEEASGKKSGMDFGLGMNPEFLREGVAVQDFMFPDRVVLGGIDDRTINKLEELYSVFEDVDILKTNTRTAEMIKYTSNSLLATMISFSNEIGNLCTSIGGIDVVDVMKGVHLDKRLSPLMADGNRIFPQLITYLEAGCGFGGSCFPKDVKALIAHGKKTGIPMSLLESVIGVNHEQPRQVVRLLEEHFVSFDDIPIIRELVDRGAEVKAFDPVAVENARKILGNGNITYCDNLKTTIMNVEAVVVLTRWDEFKTLPELLRQLDHQPLVVDGRRMLNKESVARYAGIGM